VPGITEKSFIASLTAAISDSDPRPTQDEVMQLAEAMALLQRFNGPIENAVQQAMISVSTRMGEGVSIVGRESEHDPQWMEKRQVAWTYTGAYEDYLLQAGWSGQMVQSLSDVSIKILRHLQDPKAPDLWDRRGLVIGHVQSGKTANYLGVACRAADAGYKFIVIIAGIHNNLRKQTQERTDAGFVGRTSNPAQQREVIGVGRLRQHFPHPVTLTNTQSDFSSKTAQTSGWQINDFSKPLVVVIKKNVNTLRALHKWLFDLNAQNGQIRDVPMLMIDDEADNASVDTSRDDINPTRTNAELRRILSLFGKSCYVGYTATPFANIFINPDAYDKEVRDDLFPRDFIYSLDAPSTYFGPEKVFLSDYISERVIRTIQDTDGFQEGDSLPESLLDAVDAFVVAKSIRLLRGQGNSHCSMLVNVSARVHVQQSVRSAISLYIRLLREAVAANYAMGDGINGNYHMERLHAALKREFRDVGVNWETLRGRLQEAVQSVRLFVVNSKSDEVLDYSAYERNGESLTAIAVGGLSLSRGLTLEGLTISYMHRNTSTYDTLMQMGRWFGYRPGYEDLCRVYLPPQSIDWYRFIAEKTEDLRDQIRRMRREGKTPKEFGLYMERHPARLLITAANKMRHAEDYALERNLSGTLIETHILPRDKATNCSNEALIAEAWRSGLGGQVCATSKGWIAMNADTNEVIAFLNRYDPYLESMRIELNSARDFLHEIAEAYPKADVLFIRGPMGDGDDSSFLLDSQERNPDAKKSDDVSWRMSKDRVASRGDEKLGLTTEQLASAERLAIEEHQCDPLRSEKPSDKHFRAVRNKPLLMIHSLGIKVDGAVERVPAIGVSFPFWGESRAVRVRVNKVWLRQMRGVSDDNPDEEEDYDEPAPALG
jgi:hypothetical protein